MLYDFFENADCGGNIKIIAALNADLSNLIMFLFSLNCITPHETKLQNSRM
jgi:hypothetical protein